jgi:Dolichyl-phosphate-mannose-protein mannosyltransferase
VLKYRARPLTKILIGLTAVAFAWGVAIRVDYVLRSHRPQDFIYSDMEFYLQVARRLAENTYPLGPWDVTHPLAFPALLAQLLKLDPSLSLASYVQLAFSLLVPLAAGLLGAAAFGRRTGLAMIGFASLYWPYIDYGGFFLSEVHFIFWLALAFAGLLGAKRASTPLKAGAASVVAGLALSIASAFKSVAIPAALCFFAVDGLAALLARSTPATASRADPRASTLVERLSGVILRGTVTLLCTLPVLAPLARTCTRANAGKFCVTGNKVGADFLLGHYGRIGGIHWNDNYQFGSPGAYLRHYTEVSQVPFALTDSPANAAEAWRWIAKHPIDSLVLSLDHVYDAFFGVGAWPSYATRGWRGAHLSQYAFLVLLFLPTMYVCERLLRRGLRDVVASRSLLVLSPIAALAVTVAIATGEVRYRIPFDLFFMVVVCALAMGDLSRWDGEDEIR